MKAADKVVIMEVYLPDDYDKTKLLIVVNQAMQQHGGLKGFEYHTHVIAEYQLREK